MSLLQDLFSRKITALTKEQLDGTTNIVSLVFRSQSLLTSVEIPDSIKNIGVNAFHGCTSLEKVILGKNVSYMGWGAFNGCTSLADINTDKINPYCILGIDIFSGTAWYENQPEESMITIANGQILVGNKITTPSSGFEIPDTIKNLAPYSCKMYGNTDSSFTSIVIPDTVEMIQESAFNGQSALTQITFGSSVKTITGTITPSTNVENLIFRQPAGMYIELPTAGSTYGMFYDKSSYSMNIYTDNEYIKNYDWATDNVTATFYSLSEAPA